MKHHFSISPAGLAHALLLPFDSSPTARTCCGIMSVRYCSASRAALREYLSQHPGTRFRINVLQRRD
ncbi:uncharacterized protein M421DRAFT_419942, partial [Didymella exigua CBS 183.55]